MGANEVPQLTPSMQSDEVFIVSYMMIGHDSPVDILKRMIIACVKF